MLNILMTMVTYRRKQKEGRNERRRGERRRGQRSGTCVSEVKGGAGRLILSGRPPSTRGALPRWRPMWLAGLTSGFAGEARGGWLYLPKRTCYILKDLRVGGCGDERGCGTGSAMPVIGRDLSAP
eukprot:747586-Hanusia_phi.AAC.2